MDGDRVSGSPRHGQIPNLLAAVASRLRGLLLLSAVRDQDFCLGAPERPCTADESSGEGANGVYFSGNPRVTRRGIIYVMTLADVIRHRVATVTPNWASLFQERRSAVAPIADD